MKKSIIGLLSILLVTVSVQAQEGKKALKQAEKLINKYVADPAANGDMLAEGLSMLDKAFMADEVASDAKSFVKKGQIYNSIADAEMKVKLLNPEASLITPEAGMKAYAAFAKVLEMGDREKDALAGLESTQGILNNIAITYFRSDNYGGAYKNYAATLELHDILTANKKTSMLTDETINEQKFYTAATAYYSDNVDKVLPILEELFAGGTKEALVYEALYGAKKETDPEGALAVLEAGRVALPDDAQLLFAEINHYLSTGDLDVLINKLEVAKSKEPDNLSVVVTTGSVYDQLNQQEREAGNIEKANEYLDKARLAYEEVLAVEADNFDATYSLGALYYNKAAAMTTKINELSNDFSPAGTKKYDALKTEMDGYFQQALPYFERAEAINGEDPSTLVALKEIAARNNDFEKADAYKKRIEALQQGE